MDFSAIIEQITPFLETIGEYLGPVIEAIINFFSGLM